MATTIPQKQARPFSKPCYKVTLHLERSFLRFLKAYNIIWYGNSDNSVSSVSHPSAHAEAEVPYYALYVTKSDFPFELLSLVLQIRSVPGSREIGCQNWRYSCQCDIPQQAEK